MSFLYFCTNTVMNQNATKVKEDDVETGHSIAPHGGGTLVDRMCSESEEESFLSQDAPEVSLSTRRFWDLQMIGHGVYSPLTGFLDEEDYTSVRDQCRLRDGTVWPFPITLPVDEEQKEAVRDASHVVLNGPGGTPAGVILDPDVFQRNLANEAKRVYQTEEREHPGVRNILDESSWVASGDVRVFDRSLEYGVSSEHQLWPDDTRTYFQKQDWNRIVGFQTRNPMHRAHEYLVKCAMEITDAVMVHPLVGPTKDSDVPATVRMKCYRTVLNNYYPEDRTFLNIFPAPMRYGGPREAVFHALCRKNYGCTHFIVGRDHAGVGDYYGTYEAQNFIDDFPEEDIGITPLFFEFAFFCSICDGMATAKTCPHDPENHLFLSGTKVREKLRNGEDLPVEFTRREVAEILMDHYQSES